MEAVTISKRSILTLGLILILVGLLLPQTVAAEVPIGFDPNNPIGMTMVAGQASLNTGKLEAGQETWFEVKLIDPNAPKLDEDGNLYRPPLDLTFFVTPVDGSKIQNVHMDLFPASYARSWSAGHVFVEGVDADDKDMVFPFGTERIVDRSDDSISYAEGDPYVGTLAWSGNVNNDEAFLLRIQNDNSTPVDYWLFNDTIGDVELGQGAQPGAEAAVVRPSSGIDPNHPIAMTVYAGQTGHKTGKLAAGQETWLAVTFTDPSAPKLDEDGNLYRPPFDLTLFVTPVDGNKVQNIHMDLFPANYAQSWSAGHVYVEGVDTEDRQMIFPFGTERIVDRTDESIGYAEGDPYVGTLVWGGNVNNGEMFLVHLQNDNSTPVDFWLFTDNVIDIDLD